MSSALNAIDNILNRITMYRLILYYLAALLAVAGIFGFFGILPYTPAALFFSAAVLVAVSWAANGLFARVFGAHTNVESAYITALILALIITPVSWSDGAGVSFLAWAAIWAMASKYILAIRKKHVFNPAAFAVAITSLVIGRSASWWVGGNIPMLPFVLAGGLLVTRKIRRADLVLSFFAAAFAAVAVTASSGDPFSSVQKALLHAPLFFFAFVMLTEPLTTPPARMLRIAYGLFVGALFAPAVHVGAIYSTPELALLAGNVFSYLVSPKGKYILRLRQKKKVGSGMYDFVFTPDADVRFLPGQYMEWTLTHKKPDSRGNRRYFTIASSPAEKDLRIGVKFYDTPSSFKKELLAMQPGAEIACGQIAGDFVLPRNKKKKLAFLAGGIGITPFRSMIRHLLDTNELRPITLLYSAKTASEIAYSEVFEEARRRLGIRTVYALTDQSEIPSDWKGGRGVITEAMIRKEIPDYRERTFFISGPHGMVAAFERVLKNMGVPRRRIRVDFFPGFA